MSLSRAHLPDGRPLLEDGVAPMSGEQLMALVGVPFDLPADDPWVLDGGDEAHAYLDGARAAWVQTPEWMDFLDPDSPAHVLKTTERDLYLHHWAPWLEGAQTVLDVGCGVGRFVQPLVAMGKTVWGVDADLASLHRCAWHAAGGAGALDLSWSSVHVLPEIQVDLAIACEVLCYVPALEEALATLVARIRPGGVLLLAMEARWGWAASPDAPEGGIAHALVGDGVIDLPGDRWVRTFERDELVALLDAAGLEVECCVATNYVLDGPLESVTSGVPDLDALLDLEEACRVHPVWEPLNRIWTVAARKR